MKELFREFLSNKEKNKLICCGVSGNVYSLSYAELFLVFDTPLYETLIDDIINNSYLLERKIFRKMV